MLYTFAPFFANVQNPNSIIQLYFMMYNTLSHEKNTAVLSLIHLIYLFS